MNKSKRRRNEWGEVSYNFILCRAQETILGFWISSLLEIELHDMQQDILPLSSTLFFVYLQKFIIFVCDVIQFFAVIRDGVTWGLKEFFISTSCRGNNSRIWKVYNGTRAESPIQKYNLYAELFSVNMFKETHLFEFKEYYQIM